MAHKPEFGSYDDFWLAYVREHSVAANRWLHFIGTSLALATLAYALATRTWLLLVLVPVVGYGLAWIGHFFVEKNRPVSFSYPGWALFSDLRMWWFFLTGRMRRELDRAATVGQQRTSSS